MYDSILREDCQALVTFANVGNAVTDIKDFQRQNSNFFDKTFYADSIWLASQGKDSPFAWYQRVLRKVWLGHDDGTGLAVLLGVRDPNRRTVLKAFEAESKEWQLIQNALEADKVVAPPLRVPELFPDWRSGGWHYKGVLPFQSALSVLAQESWRARVCPIDGKFLMAIKPTNVYCSPECSTKAKNKRALQWWHDTGSNLRKREAKRGNDEKGNQSSRRLRED